MYIIHLNVIIITKSNQTGPVYHLFKCDYYILSKTDLNIIHLNVIITS